MAEITDRQKELLKAVIEEYIETAEPVGSESIVKKHQLGVSPATIRNEMASLIESGYLKQPHTSAGRVPTPMGLKHYIKEGMREQEVPVKDEVKIKENLWDYRFQFPRLLKFATNELAEKTGTLALAVSEDGDIYYSGASNILDMPEFYDIDLTKTVLTMLDRHEMLTEIFNKAVGDEPVHILLGDELGFDYMEYAGVVFSPFGSGKRNAGVVGIVGPTRMKYDRVIPTVRYFGDLLTELSGSW
jgi:heat-inducible transcriptional repressor